MIVFVRHGETDLNRRGFLQGRVDEPLNATGYAQAERLAAAIATLAPARVIASPLARAAETARVIAGQCGLSVATDARLIEMAYGEWDARAINDVWELASPQWWTDPHYAPTGGESLADVAHRMQEFLDECARTEDGITVAVTHVSPIKAAVTHALGVSPLHAWNMRLDLASITRISSQEPGWTLRSFNETAHLAD